MSEIPYGKFKLEVSPPYPCWVSIEDGDGGKIKLSHRELYDLLHCVQMACMLSRSSLSENHQHEAPKGYA